MKVSTEELRRAALAMLRHVEESGQKEFEIAEDFYWDVPAEKRYAPYEEPKELTMGQLSDDWWRLRRWSMVTASPLRTASSGWLLCCAV